MAGEDVDAKILLERLTHVQSDVSDIKTTVKCIDKRVVVFEKGYIKEHEKVVNRVDDAHSRLEAVEREQNEQRKLITKLQESIQPLVTTNKILTWLGGIIMTSVLILIWMMITGQVQLVFR